MDSLDLLRVIRHYLNRANDLLEEDQAFPLRHVGFNLFSSGGSWLASVALADGIFPTIRSKNQYALYGILKYGLSLGAAFTMLLALPLAYAIPSSILGFYAIESLLFFVFPLLISGSRNPIRQSIALVIKLGYFKIFILTIRLAIFMIGGLMNFRNPTRNWSVGCLVTLLVLKDEVDGRQ